MNIPLAAIRISRAAGRGRADFRALGTDVTVLTADPARAGTAALEARAELAAVEVACHPHRPGSELAVANRAGGHPVAVSPLLAEAVDLALRTAERTGGALDPAVGPGGWRSVRFNRRWGTLHMPAGMRLDLSATVRALAAERAATRASKATGGAFVLVRIGADIATAGPVPAGGWNIRVGNRPVLEGSPR